jgi:type IV secretory pathway VirB10-like protein
MKRFVNIVILCIGCLTAANAQNTFTQRIQQKNTEREGKLTITHSAAIDLLVNGKQNAAQKKLEQPATEQKKQEPVRTDPAKQDAAKTSQERPTVQTEKERQEAARAERAKTRRDAAQAEKDRRDASKSEDKHDAATTAEGVQHDDGEEPTPVDTRKKVMRKSYRVTGYRVQAYAGGNQRKDRQRAEQIGNEIKMNYPEEPVYVHFYSPRWICRVGNYRTYEEAHQMLLNLRKLGFTSATIVKGKISIQY